jgi:hypothetical protein
MYAEKEVERITIILNPSPRSEGNQDVEYNPT